MNEIVTKLLASTAAVALAAFNSAAFAQSPQGASVAAGSIAVTRQGATTVVTQGTERGIIDWRSFSIGAQEAVRFDQPGRSSVTLNRVTGSELSRIDGNLSATGQVWLANPNGVLIGPGGQVNVGGLLATTGRIDAAEFLRSGRAAIDQIGKDAAIVNRGTINILDGGYAALAAASIRNDGVIAARTGSVALGSGKAMTVDFVGDKLITFQVNEAMAQAPEGDSMIANGGTIAAAGGTVLMSARAAKGVMDNVINLKGHVIANSVKVDGGTVSFGDGGIVQVSGRIDASSATGKGGDVAVLGEKVGLMDGASIDASGATGGGTVLVGGDWQGVGGVQNAQFAYVAPMAMINVDATMAGDGGKAVVWADEATRFYGKISARGGQLAGDGGKVETSGKRGLDVGATATVTTRAPSGRAGEWLLDPSDVIIYAVSGAGLSGSSPNLFFDPPGPNSLGADVINTALANGDNITIKTAAGSGGSGDIIFNTGTISYAGSSTVTLTMQANRNITFNSGTEIDVTGSGKLNVNLQSRVGGSTTLGAVKIGNVIKTGGGDITIGGSPSDYAIGGLTNLEGVSILAGASLDAGGGAITMLGRGAADYAGVLIQGVVKTSGTGTISITGDSPSASTYTGFGVQIGSTGSVQTSGTGAITITGSSLNSSSGSHGVYVQGSIKNTGSSTGLITLTGTRGSGSTSRNIAISGGSVMSGLGDITLNGDATTSFGVTGGYGVQVNAGTVSTDGGSIIIKGAGDQGAGGSANIGVVIDGNLSTISVTTGLGSITLTGKRGGGSGSQNILLFGGSSTQLATLSTASGSITLDGSVSTVGATTTLSTMDGVFTQNALIKSGGDISINGNADTIAKFSSNGVVIDESSTISLTGAAGKLSILGNAQSAPGNDIFFQNSTVSGGTGTVTLTGDKINGTGVAWTSGKTVLLPRSATNIDVLGNPTAGTLGLGSALGFIAGPVEIGSSSLNSLITYSGTTIDRDLTLISSAGNINFTGASLDSPSNAYQLTVKTDGVVSFAGSIGGSDQLKSLTRSANTGGNVGKSLFGSGVAEIKTNLAQYYSGPVELEASTVTFNSSSGAITFNGPVDSASTVTADHTNMIVNASTGGVLFKNNFGLKANQALKSFTSGTGTAVTFEGSDYVTDGAQSYDGVILLGGDAKISAGGAVTVGQAINSVAVADPKALSITAPSATLAGNIGATSALSTFTLSVNNGALTQLPGVTTKDLTLSTGVGAITQLAAMTVTGLAKISTTGGDVTLGNASNNFKDLNVTVGSTGKALIRDGGGDLNVTGASVGGTLGLQGLSTGAITQTGAISASTLAISDANEVTLTHSGNSVGVLDASLSGATKALKFSTTGTLTLGTVTANTATLGAGTLNGATNLTVANAPLSLAVNSGTLTNVSVNSLTGAAAAAGGNITVTTTGGSISVNGVTLSGPPVPPPVVTPTTPTTATVASVATVATVASIATIAPTVASVATIATVPTVASLATVSTTSFVQTVIALLNASVPAGVTTILNQVLPPSPNFGLAFVAPQPLAQPSATQGGPATSAQALANIVTATPAGAFIPVGPPVVAGTGAPLASAPTIKVDAADTGGANGQVIAIAAPGGGSGERAVVPGILSEVRSPRANAARVDPPLGQQPPTINEEPLLD